MLTPPEFISTDVDVIQKEMIARYEELTGRTLQPGQPERLLINSFAYRESLLRGAIQEAAKQNLVEFSTAPVLDYLADLVGVNRLSSTPAKVTIEFTKVGGSGSVTVPSGTRVQSVDGEVAFSTVSDLQIEAGETTAEVEAEAINFGVIGNGYVEGQIDNILDPQSFISEAVNVNESAGGAEQETDAALRERIKLAPASFSTAGSRDSYRFHAITANPSIIDVSVISLLPGEVTIYPLVAGGIETPQQVIDDVTTAVNAERVRPLTDAVFVLSPEKIEYTLGVSLTVLDSANQPEIISQVNEALEELTESKFQKVGIDITTSEVIRVAMIEDVYSVDVTITGPGGVVDNLIIESTQFGFATDITVTVDDTTSG